MEAQAENNNVAISRFTTILLVVKNADWMGGYSYERHGKFFHPNGHKDRRK